MTTELKQDVSEIAKNTRIDRLTQYGLSEETAAMIKTLLEQNGYRVDTEYFISIVPANQDFNHRPQANLVFNDGLIHMSTNGSHWTMEESKAMNAQVAECLRLMELIAAFAPTVINPEFRDALRKAEASIAKEKLLAKIERWNALPQSEEILTLSNGWRLVLKRGKAEYKQGYRTSFWTGLELNANTFWADQYIT